MPDADRRPAFHAPFYAMAPNEGKKRGPVAKALARVRPDCGNVNCLVSLGKRRIPAPLIIRRHAGATPLQDLAGEILGLSKMHWNTFDLYTKHPATLQSSNEIAKIGSLLHRFGTASYDYRLLM